MIASLLLAALAAHAEVAGSSTIGREYRPGDEATWIFEKEGKRIGEHASRYLGIDDLAGAPAHHFQGWLRLEMAQLGGQELRSLANLWTDDGGHPLRFTTYGFAGQGYSRADAEFVDGVAQVRVAQGSSVRERPVGLEPGALLLANNYVSHIEMALVLATRGEDASIAMYSASKMNNFYYKLAVQGTFEHEQGGRRRRGFVYQDSLDGRLCVVDGRLLELEVEEAKLVICRKDEKFERLTIVAPHVRVASAAFWHEDVRIPSGTGEIAATVTKRKGVEGRLPAVLFVSDSGPQDRHGFSSGIDLGTHEILDRLTADGFLVLRVDDRGAGESSPSPADVSYLDHVSDARACVEFLKQRKDVDPARIALIGHGEGGETAPILAAEPLAVAAIVLMAAPGRSLLEVMADQSRLALEKKGLRDAELEAKLAEVVALQKSLWSDQAVDSVELSLDQRLILTNPAWFRSRARQDPIAAIRKVRCPVLILQGSKDSQVSLDRDARALEVALKDAKHPDHELRAFEKLDHVFKEVPGEKSELTDYMKDRPVAPEFLDALSGWLRTRLKVEQR